MNSWVVVALGRGFVGSCYRTLLARDSRARGPGDLRSVTALRNDSAGDGPGLCRVRRVPRRAPRAIRPAGAFLPPIPSADDIARFRALGRERNRAVRSR